MSLPIASLLFLSKQISHSCSALKNSQQSQATLMFIQWNSPMMGPFWCQVAVKTQPSVCVCLIKAAMDGTRLKWRLNTITTFCVWPFPVITNSSLVVARPGKSISKTLDRKQLVNFILFHYIQHPTCVISYLNII